MAAGNGKLVTRRQVAEALAVHPMTVTKWERRGLPIAERGARGRPSLYDLRAVRGWLAARDAAARAAAEGPLDPLQAKAERDRWQAAIAEQTFTTRARELLPAGEVEQAWAAEVTAVRAKLLALPVVYADRVYRAATLEGLSGVEHVLQAAVHDTLRELSEGNGDNGGAPGPALAAPEAPAGAPAGGQVG